MSSKFGVTSKEIYDAALEDAQRIAQALLTRQVASQTPDSAIRACVVINEVAKVCADEGTLKHLDAYRNEFIDNNADHPDGLDGAALHFDTLISTMLMIGCRLVGSQIVVH